MKSLTIKHEGASAEVFAATLQVISQELHDKSLALAASAEGHEITDAGSFAKANDLASVMHATEKELEARRLYLKRPLLDVGKAIEAIVDAPASQLSMRRKSLVGKIAAWDAKQKAIAAEVQRKAREAAEAEQREAQRVIDEAHSKKVSEAKAAAEAEAKALEELLGAPVVVAPVIVAPAAAAVPVRVAPAPVAVPASAVTTRLVPKLVITDPRKVAALYQVGMEILVRLDESAIKRALDSGAIIDGAHIEMVEQIAMRRQS